MSVLDMPLCSEKHGKPWQGHAQEIAWSSCSNRICACGAKARVPARRFRTAGSYATTLNLGAGNEKGPASLQALDVHGGRGGNRTPDTGIFNPLLYQLSYPAGTLRRWAVRARHDTDGPSGGQPASHSWRIGRPESRPSSAGSAHGAGLARRGLARPATGSGILRSRAAALARGANGRGPGHADAAQQRREPCLDGGAEFA